MIPYGHQWVDEEDIEEVIKVLKSDWVTQGLKIQEFENALCEYVGCTLRGIEKLSLDNYLFLIE